MRCQLNAAIFISCLFVIGGCSSSKTAGKAANNVLPATALQPYGRYLLDANQNIELISSGVHFGFSFTGNTCTVYAAVNDTASHNYLQYELDGVYRKRLKVTGNIANAITITAPAGGNHIVYIYKATEATTGPIILQKIIGDNIKTVAASKEPLIEFIGNSITCGAAADTSEVPCGQGVYHDHHNAYYAYGPRVARALHTNFIMSSVSGIGIYRTWNMDNPSMPLVYEKESLSVEDTLLWDFKKYSPQIVSIALGTNDLSRGDGVHARTAFDSARFVKDYTAFVQLVKSKYPQATIALLSSPMITGDSRILLQNCLTAVKQNIDVLYPTNKKTALFFFEPMKAGGCSGHPSIEDHAVLAQQLIPFFKSLL